MAHGNHVNFASNVGNRVGTVGIDSNISVEVQRNPEKCTLPNYTNSK